MQSPVHTDATQVGQAWILVCVMMEISARHRIHSMWVNLFVGACHILPSPGDILLHDQVPFTSQDACQSYIDSWNGQALKAGLPSNNSKVGSGQDKTDFLSRGKMWFSTMKTILTTCASVDSCKDLVEGMTGKKVQDCIDRCFFNSESRSWSRPCVML